MSNSEFIDFRDVWLDIARLCLTEGTDPDVARLRTEVQTNQTLMYNTREDEAVEKLPGFLAFLRQELETAEGKPSLLENINLIMLEQNLEAVDRSLTSRIRRWLLTEPHAIEGEVADLRQIFLEHSDFRRRVNELHRRVLFKSLPDPTTARWEWWLQKLNDKIGSTKESDWATVGPAHARDRIELALAVAESTETGTPPLPLGFFDKLLEADKALYAAIGLTPSAPLPDADKDIVTPLRAIIDAATPWSEDGPEYGKLNAARMALMHYVMGTFQHRMSANPTAVTAEELGLYRWMRAANRAEIKHAVTSHYSSDA